MLLVVALLLGFADGVVLETELAPRPVVGSSLLQVRVPALAGDTAPGDSLTHPPLGGPEPPVKPSMALSGRQQQAGEQLAAASTKIRSGAGMAAADAQDRTQQMAAADISESRASQVPEPSAAVGQLLERQLQATQVAEVEATSLEQVALAKAHAVAGLGPGVETGLGSHATLNEEGYQTVLALKSNHEMQQFLRRTIEDLGLVISDVNGLQGTAPWYSGHAGTSTFGNFKGKVLNMLGSPASWVDDPNAPKNIYNGDDAPISEEGYAAVAALRSNVEMIKFLSRVVKSMGYHVVELGGVQGLAPYYSGDKQVQSLAAMSEDVESAAETPGSWVTKGAPQQASSLIQLSRLPESKPSLQRVEL